MPQSGYTPIPLYRSTTAGAAPLNTDLVAGELALNIANADMALYTKNASGVVKRLINNPVGLKYPTADGSANQVIKTDGSGNLAFATSLTSVSATAPVVSSGGLTPTISMAAATTSANGYLTSTDWNTFNGKQAALGYTPAIQKGTASDYGGAKFSLSGTTLTITTT